MRFRSCTESTAIGGLGSASILVLLPGLDGTGVLFDNLRAALAPGIDARVLAYPSSPALGYSEIEALVRRELPTNEPFVLLGESFGGPIAIRVAADPPRGLCGLVLAVTFARNPYPWLAWLRGATPRFSTRSIPLKWRLPLLLGSNRDPQILRQIERAHRMTDPATINRRVQEVIGVDAADALARIAVPILLLRARRDRLVPSAASSLIERLGRNVESVTLDAPHMLLQTRAVEAATQLERFMARLGGPP